MFQIKGYLYAVYDSKNRIVGLYASETWAKRKAKTSKDYRVESYVHTNNRRLIKIAECESRGDSQWLDNMLKTL